MSSKEEGLPCVVFSSLANPQQAVSQLVTHPVLTTSNSCFRQHSDLFFVYRVLWCILEVAWFPRSCPLLIAIRSHPPPRSFDHSFSKQLHAAFFDELHAVVRETSIERAHADYRLPGLPRRCYFFSPCFVRWQGVYVATVEARSQPDVNRVSTPLISSGHHSSRSIIRPTMSSAGVCCFPWSLTICDFQIPST